MTFGSPNSFRVMYCFIMHLLDGGNFVKFSRVQLEFFVRFAIFTFL